MFYDFHTYSINTNAESTAIVNYTIGMTLSDDQLYSVGLHPWNVSKNDLIDNDWEIIEDLAQRKNVMAIGECGLDNLYPNIDHQIDFFERHIALANKLQKPLIIHCVKAFETIIPLLKEAKVPMIIHGVNNKIGKLEKLLELGCSFSFGASLLKTNSIARQTILSVPDTNLLFETDDAECSIETIYKEASILKRLPLEKIILQVETNIKRIFKWE